MAKVQRIPQGYSTVISYISVKGASVSLGGKPMVKGLDLTTDLALTRREKSISYEFKALEAREAGR